MSKIFVISGKARVGKDSVAQIIESYYPAKKVLIYSCSEYLKKYIQILYGWDGREETKPRTELQKFGAEIKEKYPNFFLDRMKEDIVFFQNYYDIIVITGIRLVAELNFLKTQFDSILIKIEKDNYDNGLTIEQKNDITETDIDNFKNFDYVIKNNESVENLKEKVLKLVRSEENEY